MDWDKVHEILLTFWEAAKSNCELYLEHFGRSPKAPEQWGRVDGGVKSEWVASRGVYVVSVHTIRTLHKLWFCPSTAMLSLSPPLFLFHSWWICNLVPFQVLKPVFQSCKFKCWEVKATDVADPWRPLIMITGISEKTKARLHEHIPQPEAARMEDHESLCLFWHVCLYSIYWLKVLYSNLDPCFWIHWLQIKIYLQNMFWPRVKAIRGGFPYSETSLLVKAKS